MGEKEFKKIEAVLEHFLSLHEADAVYDMIFSGDPSGNHWSKEDIIAYIEWCHKRYLGDEDTEFESWLKEQGRNHSGMKAAKPGTVIHGTLRNEDIITACIHALFELDPERARTIWKRNPKMNEALCDRDAGIKNDWWESEDATQSCLDIFDIMGEYSPSGHYFGAHPGDGSDFGWWECENSD